MDDRARQGDKRFQGLHNLYHIRLIDHGFPQPRRILRIEGRTQHGRLALALRLAEHGIPVYELRPGIIQTDMTSGVKDKYDALIKDGLVPQRRWGTPEDIGKTVAALARGDLPYSTGSVIMIDGGLSIPKL